MTAVKVPVKFPNVLVEVFNQGHLDAVHRVADHHGWVLGNIAGDARNFTLQHPDSGRTTLAHFGSTGELFIFTVFSKVEAEEWAVLGNAGAELYKDYKGLEFCTLRKVGVKFTKLNLVTASRDNLSALAVIPRPKYEVVPVAPVLSYNEPNELCVCLGATREQRKVCTTTRAYGSTKCYRATAARLLDKPQVPERIEWYKPKSEVSLVQKLVVASVLAFSKIVSVVKRGLNFLKGGK